MWELVWMDLHQDLHAMGRHFFLLDWSGLFGVASGIKWESDDSEYHTKSWNLTGISSNEDEDEMKSLYS